jgi:cytochrome b561
MLFRRSHYALTRTEITKGIANRFVHSRAYIFLYLGMAALSVTTVVLSLADGCPATPFYVLEFIINSSMILEVALRFIAFGRVSIVIFFFTSE